MTAGISDAQSDSNLRDSEFPAGTLRVLQLTDTHLYGDAESTLLGVNTLDSFRSVLRHFRDTVWPVDILLATGDLVHDASARGYSRLAETLKEFDVPVFCLPGNHDDVPVMRRFLSNDRVSNDTTQVVGDWQFVMLDSVVRGEEGGHLATAQIDTLEQALQNNRQHTLVCMHHQPVNVGSAWIDTMTVDNPDALFEVIDRYEHVRGILWGHVHQTFEAMRGGVRLMASPSTCVQFAPNSEDFKVDEERPGFRLLALLPDGTIRTEVLRVDDMPQGVELASAGY